LVNFRTIIGKQIGKQISIPVFLSFWLNLLNAIPNHSIVIIPHHLWWGWWFYWS